MSGPSDREEDFDVLGPTSWSVDFFLLTGARVSSVIYGTLLAFRRTRYIAINASSLGITRIASKYGRRIQWRLPKNSRAYDDVLHVANCVTI